MMRKALRGSGGYKELRRQLLMHLRDHAATTEIKSAAKLVYSQLGYDQE